MLGKREGKGAVETVHESRNGNQKSKFNEFKKANSGTKKQVQQVQRAQKGQLFYMKKKKVTGKWMQNRH